MPQSQAPFPSQIHAAFAWWQEAGVDFDFANDATDWLEQETVPKAARSESIPAISSGPTEAAPTKDKIDLLGENPPQDLAGFHDWWLSDPALDPIGIRGRIAAKGPLNADLMVVVIAPEEADQQSLLSGPLGGLFDGFLRAAGVNRDEIYLASALPRYMPVADGNALVKAGYDKVLMHHIALASPKRVLVLGKNILPLLGHEAAQEPIDLENIHDGNRKFPLLVAEGLDSMQSMPRLKARFWRKWLDWTDG
jgi:DNA polymerase